MADGFVVLQSYVDSINLLPPERRWPFFCELFKYRIDGAEPKPLTDLERMALINIFPIVDASVERYEKNKENGAKGGRPRKWIPPEEWKAFRKKHSQKETAEHFGISVDTLQRWEKTAKPQNQDIDIDLDKDIDSDKDIDINKSKSIYINKKGGTPSQPQSGSAPRPMMPGYEFVHNGKQWRINDRGEAEVIGTAE